MQQTEEEKRELEALPAKANIILADDDFTVREYVSTLLMHHKYNVLTVNNGAEAVVAMKEHHAYTDLVITDFQMPQLDGVKLSVYLRHHYPDLKIIVISGNDTIEKILAANGSPQNKIIHKPFASTELLSSIEELVRKPSLKA